MCGIAGVCGGHMAKHEAAVRAMCRQMAPRGPDGEGVLRGGGEAGPILGACRLAIIDPTPAGRQPFVDQTRGNVLVYNGMIYNHRELRRELEARGERFSSDCDTEVVLRAYGVFGAECVERLEGMFAFGVWDARRAELFLARDRLGIKPLYYCSGRDGQFLFASQVRALLASGEVEPRLSEVGIESYLAYGAVSEPTTIIDGVSALPAGHHAVWSARGMEIREYWSPAGATRDAPADDQPEAELGERLADAVARHLISDVPVGVFLSGGLDSAAIAGYAAGAGDAVTTVSVTFAEPAYSEAAYQQKVAQRLGCEHVTVELSAAELLVASADAFSAMDQPSFDAVNTYAVANAARQAGLKVALSGLGADELFDGYGQVRRIRRLERVRRLPAPMLWAAARASGAVDPGFKLKKARAWLAGELPGGESHDLLRRHFLPSEVARLRGHGAEPELPRPGRLDGLRDLPGQVSALDLGSYLKNVLLRDTDSMSMANSLEVRVPFLDDRLVGWTLGAARRGEVPPTKRELGEAVADVVPPEVLRRPKQGFFLPIDEWMRGQLREEVEGRLRETPAALQGQVDPAAALESWADFQRGRDSWSRPWGLYALWRWADSLEGVFA